MSRYSRDFDETEYLSFLLKDDKLFEKYKEIWEKVKNNIKKEFGIEPMYNKKDLKGKIKSYNEKINANFHDNKIPNEYSTLICLSVILINSVFQIDKNYYHQLFVEECKYVVKLPLKILIKKILMKKVLMRKILMKRIITKKVSIECAYLKQF